MYLNRKLLTIFFLSLIYLYCSGKESIDINLKKTNYLKDEFDILKRATELQTYKINEAGIDSKYFIAFKKLYLSPEAKNYFKELYKYGLTDEAKIYAILALKELDHEIYNEYIKKININNIVRIRLFCIVFENKISGTIKDIHTRKLWTTLFSDKIKIEKRSR